MERPVLRCILYSTEGLRHGTHAVLEFWI
jgi:hypothetical protein